MPKCTKPAVRDNIWRDKNKAQNCTLCGVQGLRFGSKTGLCNTCYSGLPHLIKAGARDGFNLERVMTRYIQEMIATFGVDTAAERMGVPTRWLEGGAGLEPEP